MDIFNFTYYINNSFYKEKRNIYYLIAILILGFTITGSLFKSVIGLYDSIRYAFKDFSNLILAIACVGSLGRLLEKINILDLYLKPFTRLIRNKYIGFWIIGLISLVLSLFFYPLPAVIIVAILFLPLAKKINMPIIWVAVSLNLFAHGFAFSGDYILRSAPTLVASAASIETNELISNSFLLWISMGLVTTITAFIILCISDKKIKQNEIKTITSKKELDISYEMSDTKRKVFALITLGLLILSIFFMFVLNIESSYAIALLCGTTIIIISIICIFGLNNIKLIETTLTDGMKRSVSLFVKTLPMIAFFYLGGQALFEVFGNEVLGNNSQGIINDFGVNLSRVFSINKVSATVITGGISAITGLDGSGFSGLPLVGALAKLLTSNFPSAITKIAFFGQMLAIYVGGGCLVPSAVVPVAVACNIDIKDLIKINMIPIIVGSIITCIITILII